MYKYFSLFMTVIHYKCKNEEGEEVLVDTSKLGSCLLESMLKEVDNLCSAQRRSTWGGSGDSRQQVPSCRFTLVCLNMLCGELDSRVL